MMEPVFLRPKEAFAAIGVKTTRGYELIKSGELEAVKLGTATLISVESIKALVTRLTGRPCPPLVMHNKPVGKAGRPVNHDIRARIVQASNDGATTREIASQFGVTPQAISYHLRQSREAAA